MEDQETPEQPALILEEMLPAATPRAVPLEDAQLKAVLEAVIYVAEEPLALAQLAASLQEPAERIRGLLDELMAEFDKPEHGIAIREVAGGFKIATKAEHHEAVRSFVKSLKPPLKLSLPALETLAVIAYKQPVTAPEVMEIRGVQGAGVLKTLLDRKLIAAAGRKNVIGKPILYKTTREFMLQFGLKDLSELPSLKEFEDIRRMSLADEAPAGEPGDAEGAQQPATVEETGEPGGSVSGTLVQDRGLRRVDNPPAGYQPAPPDSAAEEMAEAPVVAAGEEPEPASEAEPVAEEMAEAPVVTAGEEPEAAPEPEPEAAAEQPPAAEKSEES